jgi:high-affinity nickel permease
MKEWLQKTSAAGAAQGMPIQPVLVFSLLFTAGMTLIHTTDSILMPGAYGWAFLKSIRKLTPSPSLRSRRWWCVLDRGWRPER